MTRLPEKSWELLELTRMPGDAAEKVVPLALTCWHVIFLIPNSSPQKSSSPLMDTARGTLNTRQRNFGLGPYGVRFSWGWTCLGVGTWRTQACWMERLVSFSMIFYGEFSKNTGKSIPVAQIQLVQVLVIEWALVMYFIRCEWELVHTIKQLCLLLRLIIFLYMIWIDAIYLWCITVSSKGCCLKPKGCYMGTPLSSIQYPLEDPGIWYHSWISQIQTAVAFSFRLGCPAQCSPRLREQEN